MMGKSGKPVLLLLASHYSAGTLEKALEEIPSALDHDRMLVDDCSGDGTARLAHRLGLHAIVHARELGPGAVQKSLFREALKYAYPVVVVLVPDRTTAPEDILRVAQPVLDHQADVVIGSRFLGCNPREAGMPWLTATAARCTVRLFNLALHRSFTAYHSSLCAYRTDALRQINLRANSNGWMFDVELRFQLALAGARVMELPVGMPGYARSYRCGFLALARYVISAGRLMVSYAFCQTGLWRARRFRPPES